MMEAARVALVSDLDAIRSLCDAAASELKTERGGPLLLGRELALLDVASATTDPNMLVASGLFDGVVVGFAIAHVEDLDDGTRLAVLEVIYVEQEARAVGVGEALIDLVTEWAQAQKCGGIDSVVLPGMRDSKNFFEAHGLTARAIVVHRDL